LNKAALKLLRQATGLDAGDPPPKHIGSALNEFIGCWTPSEAREFDRQVKEIDGLPWVLPALD